MWKEIDSTNGRYSVSINGEIRCNQTQIILKGSHVGKSKQRDRVPYICHGLMIDGKRTFQLTHRIVAKHFISNPLNKPMVNHINENVQDNRAENLEWVNNQENSRHSNKKAIIQLSLEGELIKEYGSLYEIGDAGFKKPCISQCVNGKQKTYKGFKWQYK